MKYHNNATIYLSRLKTRKSALEMVHNQTFRPQYTIEATSLYLLERWIFGGFIYVVRENDYKKPKFIFGRFITQGSWFFLCFMLKVVAFHLEFYYYYEWEPNNFF